MKRSHLRAGDIVRDRNGLCFSISDANLSEFEFNHTPRIGETYDDAEAPFRVMCLQRTPTPLSPLFLSPPEWTVAGSTVEFRWVCGVRSTGGGE